MLTVLFTYLFVSLGFWQLDRADYKKGLYAEFEQRQSAASIDFNEIENQQLDKELLFWQKLEAEGEFLEEYQVLLDNQVENTHAGYFVYTPFKLSNSNLVVMVNRGWLLADKNRKVAPVLLNTHGVVKISGVAKDIPKTGLLLKDLPPERLNESIYRVQRINIDELQKLTNLTLLPYIFRLEPGSDHGYIKNWRLPGSGESVHYGYAFQWFAFAGVLIIIYLLLNFKRIKN